MMEEWETKDSKERFTFTCTTALVLDVPFLCKKCGVETKVTPVGVYCRRKFDSVRFCLFRCCSRCYKLPSLLVVFPPDNMTIFLHVMGVKNALFEAFNFSIDSSSVIETIRQRLDTFNKKMLEHGDVIKRIHDDDRFPDTCFACGKADASFKCSRCHGPKYCSEQCNRDGWKTHKKKCQPLIMLGLRYVDINKKVDPKLFIEYKCPF